MQNLNHVVVYGHLTQDVGADERSFQYVGNGQAKANISIAVNTSKKQGDQWVDEANFFTFTYWGKPAEALKPYLKKGQAVIIEGHLKQDRWEKDGQKRSAISLVADKVELVGNPKSSGNSGNNSVPTQQNAQPDYNPSDEFPEDIPF